MGQPGNNILSLLLQLGAHPHHETVNPLGDQTPGQFAVGMTRHDKYPRVRELGADPPDDLKAVRARQEKVDHEQARLLRQAEIQAHLSVAEGTYDGEPPHAAECHAEHLAEDCVVLYDDRFNCHDGVRIDLEMKLKLAEKMP